MEGFITTVESQSQPRTTQAEYAAARWYELGSSLSTLEAMRQRVACRDIPHWTLGLLWGAPRYLPAVTGEIGTPDPEHVAAGRAQRLVIDGSEPSLADERPVAATDSLLRCPRCGRALEVNHDEVCGWRMSSANLLYAAQQRR